MTCAMHLQDPCDEGAVIGHVLYVPGDIISVPMCWKHVRSWDAGNHGPFRTFTEQERAKWAMWAADRAKRQAARRAV